MALSLGSAVLRSLERTARNCVPLQCWTGRNHATQLHRRAHSKGVSRLPFQSANAPVELSRVMLPDDSNISGNVHGGVILKLIEQAGHITSSRHCNQGSAAGHQPVTTVLARVDHMDFLQPMYVGEVSHLQAAVTYTSPRSMEVTVDVWAENVLTCTRRHTNTATLWYVAVPVNSLKPSDQQENKFVTVCVPGVKRLTDEQQEAGRQRYLAHKAQRDETAANMSPLPNPVPFPLDSSHEERHTVLASQVTLAYLVSPSHCLSKGYLMGGSLMKVMDNSAAISAARHCRSFAVTACIDAINFHSPIVKGEVVFVTARPVFTSSRSIELEVRCEAEGFTRGSRRVTNTAYFTFVSLGKEHRAAPIPPLKALGKEERERFEAGRLRYEARKAQRH